MRRNKLWVFVFLSSLALGGCKTLPPKALMHHPLMLQIIHPSEMVRPMFVNQVRTGDEKDPLHFMAYDLRDPAMRKELRALRFACNVNERLYRIDEKEPALVHEEYKQRGSKRELIKRELLYIESDYDFLIRAGARCYSLEHYPFHWE